MTQRVVSVFQNEEQAEAAKKRALQQSANQIVDTMGQLKGAAMKVGQMLSTDPDVLPDEMVDALAKLQTDAPAMDFGMVKAAIEDAFGLPLDELYAEFSEEPVGAASIGQVHRARTHGGLDVAVKVQYPGIATTIDSDMKNLGSILNIARAKIPRERIDQYIAEVSEVLRRESDYLCEADTLERFHTVFKDLPHVEVPTPVHELCRQSVLTMEFIEGTRLHSFLKEAEPEVRNATGLRVLEAYVEMIHNHGALHADPHPGNFLVKDDGTVVFLDLGCVRDYPTAFTDGLITILIAMWRADDGLLMTTLEELGFDLSHMNADLAYDWLEMVLAPLLEDRPFDFAAWDIHERGIKYLKENPALMSFHPPREAIFYLRVLAGLRGLMGQTGVVVNGYQLARASAERFGFDMHTGKRNRPASHAR